MAIGKVIPLSKAYKQGHRKILSDPVIRLSRWMGVFYLTEDLEISYRTLAIGIILFAVLVAERVLFLTFYPFQKHMKVITILFVSVYYLNWSIALFRPIGGLRKALRESLDIAQKLDIDYTVSNLLYIPFTLIIMKYVFTTTMSPKSLTWLIELMHLASTLPTLLLQLQFAVVARFCCFAFVAMEKRIHTSDEVQLQRLASIHCKMCCLWNVFNNHFGPIILVTIGFFIALSMSYTYLFVSDSDVTWIELVRMGLRISYTLSSSMCAVYAVSRMRKEADSFNQTLKKVLFCRKYCSQENLRLYIKMKIVVIPTACGFFQLRPTLFIKIFAGLLSYTVILLQFSGKSKIPIRADK
ncbi:uncharacterized protein [Halyomorpha halys]|uniref:uncharacterized protein isoform X2 n=1 Tax=Halyomorpha halys TaxID=286706 RepID=UPI0034D33714